MTKTIYIIAGPTASGKTGLSIDLAQRLGGEIINADSIQVYQDVPVLTARPTEQEMSQIPHHLFGIMDAFSVCNVNHWLQLLPDLVEKIDVPVFVGGTGLYIKSLIEGLSPLPDIPDDIRDEVRKMTPDELLKALPNAKLTDPQRLMRALEVERATGKSLAWWQAQPKIPVLKDVQFKTILILPPREQLYLHCNYRFELMIKQGALKQVTELLEKNPKMTGGVFSALGVHDLIDFLNGKQNWETAVAHAEQLTRNYAKRQMTWFRHQLKADFILDNPLIPKDF